ncbi:MAG TPA: class I SAM-dependent methyltransferase [Allosphingosinicella sp.]|jgi:SAM-dependent methyltransferase
MVPLALAGLDVRRGETVLDVGFGGGGLIAALLEAGARAVGIDISEVAVRRARRRFGERARILLGSAEALPLGDASVHKAASLNSLYFWPAPAAAMAEFARVVRPGGRLAIAFEPPEELRKWPGHRHGFRLFAEEEVRQLMAQAGFTDIRAAWGTGRKPDRFLCLTGVRSPGDAL